MLKYFETYACFPIPNIGYTRISKYNKRILLDIHGLNPAIPMHDANIRRRISRVPLRVRLPLRLSTFIHNQTAEI